MKLSDGEKLILIMLSEIYENMQLDGEIDPDFIKSAIYSQNVWGVSRKYPGIPFQDDDTPDAVKEVTNILEMWSLVEDSYERLSYEEKSFVERKAEPFGRNPKFGGFDGSVEGIHIRHAMFLIDDLGLFQKYKDKDLNSHAPFLGAYRRMLKVFMPFKSELMGDFLNPDQLVIILLAMVHPDNK